MHPFSVPSTLPNMNENSSICLSFSSLETTAIALHETYSSQPVKQGRLHLIHAYFLTQKERRPALAAPNHEEGESR